MKVAVLLHWNEGEKSGVFKKVVTQIRMWSSQGISVSLHLVSRNFLLDVWQRHLKEIPMTFHHYNCNPITRIRAWRQAVKAVKAQRPNIVYHRYDLYMPALQSLFRTFPLILEINTNDLREYCLTKGLRCWYNRFTRALLLRGAAGLVFVTHELAGLPCFARYRKPFVIIANGISLDDYPLLPPPNNDEPRLIFLGTDGQPWHGVDKVIRMAKHFPQWRFDIVGIRRERLNQVPHNVSVHGPRDRLAYEPLLAQADVAIGTLALHRKGMNEACSLKIREYLAYGLPVIIGHKDTDFPRGAPFILELPNTEDNVESNIAKIEDFVYRWKSQRVPRSSISHIDIQVKESQRLAFFRNMLGMR